jgi:hypothetical protein
MKNAFAMAGLLQEHPTPDATDLFSAFHNVTQSQALRSSGS